MGEMYNLENNTIPVEEAIERTTLWREVYTETFEPTDPEAIFRGFRIPIEDIQELATQYENYDIKYVRAYISAQQIPTAPAPQGYKFSIVLVPVNSKGNDILTRIVDEEVKSAVYDFTQPCPPCCDIDSPLYGIAPTAK